MQACAYAKRRRQLGDTKDMKKFAFMAIFLLLFSTFSACSTQEQTQGETRLTVFAAASLSAALSEVAALYTANHPETNIVFNFDSSGTLRTQIMQGADADVFFSAATHEMIQLQEAGFILDNTPVDILENQVVLVTAGDAVGDITSFSDMIAVLMAGDVLMAMGNMDVPIGRYAQEILQYFGLDHETLAQTAVITYASNVRAVATQVREGSVDFGIVYLTDAADFGLYVVDIATAEMTGRVIYPAAVISGSQNADAAKSFLSFLMDDAAMNIFRTWGFLSPR